MYACETLFLEEYGGSVRFWYSVGTLREYVLEKA